MKLKNTDMTPHQRILEAIRDSRKTLNVIAIFYIVVGFALALASSFSGDRLGAFLGFVIISGALAFAVLLQAVLRIGLRISNLTEHVDVIRSQMDHVDHWLEQNPPQVAKSNIANSLATQPAVAQPVASKPAASPSAVSTPTISLDLTMLGKGDVNKITAAILDRSRFPRLATTMDENPPAQSQQKKYFDALTQPPTAQATPDEKKVEHSKGVSIINLHNSFKAVLRDGDLTTCRSIYSAMVDVSDPVELERFHAQVEQLADNLESRLRLRFSQGMQDHDYDDMLETGEQICRLLPDRSIAREFKQIKPMLQRKQLQPAIQKQAPQATTDPVLKVAP